MPTPRREDTHKSIDPSCKASIISLLITMTMASSIAIISSPGCSGNFSKPPTNCTDEELDKEWIIRYSLGLPLVMAASIASMVATYYGRKPEAGYKAQPIKTSFSIMLNLLSMASTLATFGLMFEILTSDVTQRSPLVPKAIMAAGVSAFFNASSGIMTAIKSGHREKGESSPQKNSWCKKFFAPCLDPTPDSIASSLPCCTPRSQN